MQEKIKSIIAGSISVKEKMLGDEQIIQTVNDCAAMIVDAFRNGNKVLFCGNGGSAADSQHIAAEIVGRYKKMSIVMRKQYMLLRKLKKIHHYKMKCSGRIMFGSIIKYISPLLIIFTR